MRDEAGEDVMAVLPDAFGDDERRVGIEAAEDFHAVFLGINETMAPGGVIGMGAYNRPALGGERAGESGLHFSLLGPAFLIGRQAEVAVGHEINLSWFQGGGFHVDQITRLPESRALYDKRRMCQKK